MFNWNRVLTYLSVKCYFREFASCCHSDTLANREAYISNVQRLLVTMCTITSNFLKSLVVLPVRRVRLCVFFLHSISLYTITDLFINGDWKCVMWFLEP